MRDVLPLSGLNPLLLCEAGIDNGATARTGAKAEVRSRSGFEAKSAGGGGRSDWGGGVCGGTGDVVLPRWMIIEGACGRCGSGGRRRGANISSALKRNVGVARGRTGSARLRLRPLLLPTLGGRAALLMRLIKPDTFARRRPFLLLRDVAREDGEGGGEGNASGGSGGDGGDVQTCAQCSCSSSGHAEVHSMDVSGNLGDVGVMTVVVLVVAELGEIDTTPSAAFKRAEESGAGVTGSSDACWPSMSRCVREEMRCSNHRLHRGWRKTMSRAQVENTTGVAMAAASMELRELFMQCNGNVCVRVAKWAWMREEQFIASL